MTDGNWPDTDYPPRVALRPEAVTADSRRRTVAVLLDHPVGANEYGVWKFYAERFRRFQIDYQL